MRRQRNICIAGRVDQVRIEIGATNYVMSTTIGFSEVVRWGRGPKPYEANQVPISTAQYCACPAEPHARKKAQQFEKRLLRSAAWRSSRKPALFQPRCRLPKSIVVLKVARWPRHVPDRSSDQPSLRYLDRTYRLSGDRSEGEIRAPAPGATFNGSARYRAGIPTGLKRPPFDFAPSPDIGLCAHRGSWPR